MNALDKKLIETEPIKEGNWVKLISVLKHQFNEWATARLAKDGYADFKMVYMPVIMNISPEGINNNVLAKHARVTKQAMSKVARELTELGYIKSKVDPKDRRVAIIMLTDRGKKLVLEARRCVKDLTNDYRKAFGAAEFDRATEMLKKVLDYNDRTFPHHKA